jgi:hypothetical protein
VTTDVSISHLTSRGEEEHALFHGVQLTSAARLHVDVNDPHLWKVIDAAGNVVASAPPQVTLSTRLGRRPPRPRHVRANRIGRSKAVVRWTERNPTHHAFSFEVQRGKRERDGLVDVAFLRPHRSGRRFRAIVRVPSSVKVVRLIVGNHGTFVASRFVRIR